LRIKEQETRLILHEHDDDDDDATALVGQGLLIVEDTRSHSVRHATLGRTPLDE